MKMRSLLGTQHTVLFKVHLADLSCQSTASMGTAVNTTTKIPKILSVSVSNLHSFCLSLSLRRPKATVRKTTSKANKDSTSTWNFLSAVPVNWRNSLGSS